MSSQQVLTESKLILEKLFPEGTVFLPADSEKGSLYWALSGKEGVIRWLVPEDSCCGLIALEEWHPFGFLSRLKWHVFKFFYFLKLLKYVPSISSIRAVLPKESTWEHLGWTDNIEPIPVIYVGTPCGVQKLIVFMVHSDKKQVDMVVKVPMVSGATKNILHEALVLNHLEKLRPGLAPAVLCQDNSIGRVSQSHLSGSLMGMDFTSIHCAFLMALEGLAVELEAKQITLDEALEPLLERFNALTVLFPYLEKKRELIESVLVKIKDQSPLPFCCVHGDFAAWNLKRSNAGYLTAVDWELASFTGLPMQDAFHFFWIQDFLFNRNENVFEKVMTMPELFPYLKQFSVDRVLGEKLYWYYLLEYWCCRLEEGNELDAERAYAYFVSDLPYSVGAKG